MIGVILGIGPLQVARVQGVGVGHLVALLPELQPVIVWCLCGLLAVLAKPSGSPVSLEELVNVHQYDMDSGRDSQVLESSQNCHASNLEVKSWMEAK